MTQLTVGGACIDTMPRPETLGESQLVKVGGGHGELLVVDESP